MRRILVACAVLAFSASLCAAGTAAASASTRTPEGVAKALYSAWQSKARKSALAVAAPEAVDKLFGLKRRKMRFEGCHVREEGGFECIYRDSRIDLSMALLVDGGASLGGYNVSALSFSSEE